MSQNEYLKHYLRILVEGVEERCILTTAHSFSGPYYAIERVCPWSCHGVGIHNDIMSECYMYWLTMDRVHGTQNTHAHAQAQAQAHAHRHTCGSSCVNSLWREGARGRDGGEETGQWVRFKLNLPSAIMSVRPYTEERRCIRVNSAASWSPRRAGVSRERRRSRDPATPPNRLRYTEKRLRDRLISVCAVHCMCREGA